MVLRSDERGGPRGHSPSAGRLKRSVLILNLIGGTFDGVALVGAVALGIALANGQGTWAPVIAAAIATILLALILLGIVRRASAGGHR